MHSEHGVILACYACTTCDVTGRASDAEGPVGCWNCGSVDVTVTARIPAQRGPHLRRFDPDTPPPAMSA